MAKYRIKKHEGFYSTNYEVQKKVWYIPFWFNFNNIDACETGYYETEKEAKEAIDANRHKWKYTLMDVD